MSDHVVGPALRTVTIHEAWEVYKNYDGNAPDSRSFATCATQQLAEEVCAILERHDPGMAEDQGEDPVSSDFSDLPWPYVEGSEWSAAWLAQKAEAERGKIATTLAEACRQAMGG